MGRAKLIEVLGVSDDDDAIKEELTKRCKQARNPPSSKGGDYNDPTVGGGEGNIFVQYFSASLNNLPPGGVSSLGDPFKVDYVKTIDYNNGGGNVVTSGRNDNVAA